MMAAPIVYLDPNMMSGILLYAFAAALLGGLTSPLGAVIGGFVVGVLENKVVALDFGRKIADGTPDEGRNNPEVVRAYLGEAV